MKGHKDRYAAVVEKYTLDGANTTAIFHDSTIFIVVITPLAIRT